MPRAVQLADDDSRALFLRSSASDDSVHALWTIDLSSGVEALVCDPRRLGDTGDLPPEERARRERARESGGGIVTYSATPDLSRVCFALYGKVFVVDVADDAGATEVPVAGPVVDPRLAPSGDSIAFVRDRRLWITDFDGSRPSSRARQPRTCPGVLPSTSPPKRWAACAVIGGRRTRRRCSLRGSTNRWLNAGTSAIPTTRPPPEFGAVSGSRCRQCRRHARTDHPRRRAHPGRLGSHSIPLPGRGVVPSRRTVAAGAKPRPTKHAGARGRPYDGDARRCAVPTQTRAGSNSSPALQTSPPTAASSLSARAPATTLTRCCSTMRQSLRTGCRCAASAGSRPAGS